MYIILYQYYLICITMSAMQNAVCNCKIMSILTYMFQAHNMGDCLGKHVNVKYQDNNINFHFPHYLFTASKVKSSQYHFIANTNSVHKRHMGPSIYDVNTEGGGVRLRWTHVDGGGGSSPMWTSTQKIKIRVH